MLEIAVSKLRIADATEVPPFWDKNNQQARNAYSVIQVHDFTGWGWATTTDLYKRKMTFVEKAVRLEHHYPGLFNRSELVGAHRTSPLVHFYRRLTAWRGVFPDGKLTIFPTDVENILPEAYNYPREYSRTKRLSFVADGATVLVDDGREHPRYDNGLRSAGMDGTTEEDEKLPEIPETSAAGTKLPKSEATKAESSKTSQTGVHSRAGYHRLANLIPPSSEQHLFSLALAKQKWQLMHWVLVSPAPPRAPRLTPSVEEETAPSSIVIKTASGPDEIYPLSESGKIRREKGRRERKETLIKKWTLERRLSKGKGMDLTPFEATFTAAFSKNPPDCQTTNNYGFETGQLRPQTPVRRVSKRRAQKHSPAGLSVSKPSTSEQDVWRLVGRDENESGSGSQLSSENRAPLTDLAALRRWASSSDDEMPPRPKTSRGPQQNAGRQTPWIFRQPLADITKKAETGHGGSQGLSKQSSPDSPAPQLIFVELPAIRIADYSSTQPSIVVREINPDTEDDSASSIIPESVISDFDPDLLHVDRTKPNERMHRPRLPGVPEGDHVLSTAPNDTGSTKLESIRRAQHSGEEGDI